MRSTSQNSVNTLITFATLSSTLFNTARLIFKPKGPANSGFKVVALTILLFVSGLTACKSSLEEELIAEAPVENETVLSARDLGASAEKGSYHLKNHTLREVFDFPIGAAVVKELLDDPQYAATLEKDFSRLSSESDFKFGSLQPQRNKYTYEKADAIVAFAKKNNMQVHGHTLVWARKNSGPTWLKNFKGDRKAWDRLLKEHITNVMRHFKGRVTSWDVVNEPVKQGGKYTECIWLEKLGPEYIIKAFKYAQEADPTAKLFLNDYGQEYGGKKLNLLLQIVADAKKQGVTIHGMGFQLHTLLNIEVAKINKQLKRVADAGMLIHISEFDVSVRSNMPKTFLLSDILARRQGDKYKEIVKGYMINVPKKQQWGITTWGVSDKNSFFNDGYKNYDHDYPLLFDKNYKAKWAYRGFIEAGLGR